MRRVKLTREYVGGILGGTGLGLLIGQWLGSRVTDSPTVTIIVAFALFALGSWMALSAQSRKSEPESVGAGRL